MAEIREFKLVGTFNAKAPADKQWHGKIEEVSPDPVEVDADTSHHLMHDLLDEIDKETGGVNYRVTIEVGDGPKVTA